MNAGFPSLFFFGLLLSGPVAGQCQPPDQLVELIDTTAYAPQSAPDVVKKAVKAANEICGMPYKYGGGHDVFEDSGYDCSGSVSYVLGKAGLLESPLSSHDFLTFGEEGPGLWITIYTRSGHVFLVIGGMRFDTTDHLNIGPGWRQDVRPPEGFTARHPLGY